MRAIQQHQTLEKKSRDREDARLKGRKSACLDRDAKNVESFLPAAENGIFFKIYNNNVMCFSEMYSTAD